MKEGCPGVEVRLATATAQGYPRPLCQGIVSRMLPLAAASGLAIVGVVILAAVLFLWWLLRAESGDEAAEQEAEQDPTSPSPPTDERPT